MGATQHAGADLEGLLRGQSAACEGFLRRYLPLIYGAVLKTLGPERSEADDIVQDVLLRLCRDDYALLRRYDPTRATLATWLSLIARSAALDAVRRRRVRLAPLDEAPAPLAPPPSPGRIDVPEETLTARQRLVLRLLYDHDLDPAEAARVLGVEAQTVRSAHHKALVKLRRLYGVEDASRGEPT